MNSITDALVLLALFTSIVLFFVFAWRDGDPDPAQYRVAVTSEELTVATGRLREIDRWLAEFSATTGVAPFKSTTFMNFGAAYKPLAHRICVSRVLCAKLSDPDLRVIVAHEVGHATRLWHLFLRYNNGKALIEEILADKTGLQLTGTDLPEWRRAFEASASAERIKALPTPAWKSREAAIASRVLDPEVCSLYRRQQNPKVILSSMPNGESQACDCGEAKVIHAPK